MRVKPLDPPVAVEPARKGDDGSDCVSCNTPDEEYIWVSERWRVRAMDRPTGLPMVLILESRSHLDLGDLPNLLAAELGVMTVRLERAIRSIDGVARVHVNRWGDGAAHLHLWFMARPYGRLQLRGTFLPLWDDILPPISESVWRENLALIAAWLAEFGGRPLAEPPRIEWKAPSSFGEAPAVDLAAAEPAREAEPALPLEGPEELEPGTGEAAAKAAVARSGAAAATGFLPAQTGRMEASASGTAGAAASGQQVAPVPGAASEGKSDSETVGDDAPSANVAAEGDGSGRAGDAAPEPVKAPETAGA